jgi:6-phosphogluconolactonase (cycloisomerase 2 family)
MSVATIGAANGLATGVANGTSQITATLGAVVSPSVTLTVGIGGSPVPVALKVSPFTPTIAVGQTADFTAVELMSDGSTQPVPGAITWTSGTTAAASILVNAGIAKGVAAGTSTITATFGTLTGSTLLTVNAALPRFAYTISPSDGVTSGYAVNGSANALAPLPALVDPGTSVQLVFEPSGHFAYTTGFDAAIRIYAVDALSGKLSPSGLPGIPAGGLGSSSGSTSIAQSTTDPSGRYLYIVDLGTSFVNAYSINTDTTSASYGAVTAIASSPTIATGVFPFGIVATPDGKFLYVTNSGDNTISGYSIGADGGLTALTLSASQFATLNVPAVPVIDPTGQFLYVPNNGGSSVSAFTINATNGALALIGSSAISTGLNAPFQAVTDPTGHFLFVTNSGDGTVASFSIGGTGALTAMTTVPTGLTGASSFPNGIAVDPTGAFVVIANNGENTTALFSLNGAGALTAKFTAESRIIPEFISFYAGTAAPAIGPANVFAANGGSGNISGFTATNTTGILGTATVNSAQAGNSVLAAGIATDLLYSTSSSAKLIGGFSVASSTATLTALTGAPFTLSTATDVPSAVATEPSSRTFYVADGTGNNIETFPTGNSPSSLGTNSFTSVKSIAVDPQGVLILALGNGSITSAGISGFTGTLMLGGGTNTLTQAGNWTSGAVDPTGQWLVALDSTGKTLQSVQIAPVQNGFTGTDGMLTAVGSPVATTGVTTPSSVVFDPLGNFVFVSDSTSGTVTAFGFNESNGAITATGKQTIVDATGTGKVSIDASGAYLYAGIKGNGGSVVSAVAAYKINSDGSLTALAGSPFAAGASTSGTADVVVTSSVK